MNCNNINPDFVNTFPTPDKLARRRRLLRRTDIPGSRTATSDGEASLAVKSAVANGPVLTSLVGYTLTHNTLDNNKNPTAGTAGRVQAGFRRRRRRRQVRPHHRRPLQLPRGGFADVVGLVHLQGGQVAGWAAVCACSIISRWAPIWCAASRRRALVRAT